MPNSLAVSGGAYACCKKRLSDDVCIEVY